MADHPSERYQRGMQVIRKILPDTGVASTEENLMDMINDIAPDVGQMVVEFVMGDILSRPALDLVTREKITVGVLTAIGAELELETHIGIALEVGNSRQEVIEVIIQQMVYAGFPRAVTALKIAREVFRKRDARGVS